jgi:hypothetical protein
MNIRSDQRYPCSESLAVRLDFHHEAVMTTASARTTGPPTPFSLRFDSDIAFTAADSLISCDTATHIFHTFKHVIQSVQIKMSPERRRGDDISRVGVTTESSTFRQSLESISSVLTAVWLALETILFTFGVHPGYLLHRLDTAMDRIAIALGFKGDRSGTSEAASFGDGTRTVVKKRYRVGRSNRSKVETRMNVEGALVFPLINRHLISLIFMILEQDRVFLGWSICLGHYAT